MPKATSGALQLDFNGVCRLFGLNLLACVAFFLIFSIVHRLEFFKRLLSTRKYVEDTEPERRFEKPLDSFFTWIPALWNITDEDVVDSAGLDASVYLRMFRLSIQLLGVYCIIGMVILMPTNRSAGPERTSGKESIKSLDTYSIVNIDNKSNLLWVHFFCNVILSLYTIVLLSMHCHYVWGQRHRFLQTMSRKQKPEEFTLLVTDVPEPKVVPTDTLVNILPGSDSHFMIKRNTLVRLFGVLRTFSAGMVRTPSRIAFKGLAEAYSREIDTFYKHLYPNSYLTHQPVSRFRKVKHKYQAWRAAVVQLNRAEWRQKKMMEKRGHRWVWKEDGMKAEAPRPKHKLGFLGLFGEEVDSIEYWEKKLPKLEDELEQEQEASKSKRVAGSAFISFKRRSVAAVASQTIHSIRGSTYAMQMAPAPSDVYWPNIELRLWERTLREHVTLLLVVVVIVWFTVPVTFFSSLVDAKRIRKIFPSLQIPTENNKDSINTVSRLVSYVLPSLGLRIFLWIIPPLFLWLSYLEGSISHSEAERRTCIKHYYILLFAVFFGYTFASTLIDKMKAIIESPRNVAEILAGAIPRASTLFIPYVFISSLMFGVELLRLPVSLLRHVYLMLIVGKDAADREQLWDQGGIVYYVFMPQQNLIITMGVVFAVIAPLILPFVLLYSLMGYFVWKHQAMYVYSYPYQTGGLLWPVFADNVWTAMVIGQLTMVGVFSLNEAFAQAGWSAILPLLTLYMRYITNKMYKRSFRCLPLQLACEVDDFMDSIGFKATKKTFAGHYIPPYLRPFPRLSQLDHDDSTGDDGVRTDRILAAVNPDAPPPPDEDDDPGAGLGAPAGTPINALQDWHPSDSKRSAHSGGADGDWVDSDESEDYSLGPNYHPDGGVQLKDDVPLVPSHSRRSSKDAMWKDSSENPVPSPTRKHTLSSSSPGFPDAGEIGRLVGGVAVDSVGRPTWARRSKMVGETESPLKGPTHPVVRSPRERAYNSLDVGVLRPEGSSPGDLSKEAVASERGEEGGEDGVATARGEELGGGVGTGRGSWGKQRSRTGKSVHFEIGMPKVEFEEGPGGESQQSHPAEFPGGKLLGRARQAGEGDVRELERGRAR